MRLRLVLVVCLLVVFLAWPAVAKDKFDHKHTKFQNILQSYVKDGAVDYDGLKHAGKGLRRYIGEMGSISEKRLKTFTRDQKLAYWLNFYNACVLDVISRNMPETSTSDGFRTPRQIKGLWTANKWGTPFGTRSLNSIEFDHLRKFRQSLWVLGVNRGTVGGGYLRSHAYTGAKVKQQLQTAVRRWMAQSGHFEVDVAGKELRVSTYLMKHLPDLKREFMVRGELLGHTEAENVFAHIYFKVGTDKAAKEMLRKGKFALLTLPYDQSLNELKTAK